MQALLAEQMLVLFVILVIGSLIAQFSWRWMLRRAPILLATLLLAAPLLTSCTLFPPGELPETPPATPADLGTVPTAYPEPERTGQARPQLPQFSPTAAAYPGPQAGGQVSATSAAYPGPVRTSAVPTTAAPVSPTPPVATNTSTQSSSPGSQPTATVPTTPEPTAVPTTPIPGAATSTKTPPASPMPSLSPTMTPTRTFTPTPVYSPTPSWTAPPLPDSGFQDDFEGGLDGAWKWYYPDPEYISLTLSPGFLRIYPQRGGLPDGNPRNLILAFAPEGDFEISTLLKFEPVSNYQFAGLMIYTDLGNALQFGISYADCADPLMCKGRALYFSSFQDGAPGPQSITTLDGTTEPIYLRLLRQGKNYRAQYSQDGVEWNEAGVLTNPLTPVWVGLFSGQAESGYDPAIYALFDYFDLSLLP